MQKTIDVTELQSHFLSVFEEVTQDNTLYILTRDGRPEAAILSYEEFLRFRRLQEEKLCIVLTSLSCGWRSKTPIWTKMKWPPIYLLLCMK